MKRKQLKTEAAETVRHFNDVSSLWKARTEEKKCESVIEIKPMKSDTKCEAKRDSRVNLKW